MWNRLVTPWFRLRRKLLTARLSTAITTHRLISRSIRFWIRLLISFWKKRLWDPPYYRGYDDADDKFSSLSGRIRRIWILWKEFKSTFFCFYPGHIAVQLRDRITDEWIESLFRLNGTTRPTLRRIVPSMFKAIPKETIVACIEIEGRMVASGLGILDRGHIGLYAIYVDASCRRKHFARAICSSILTEAQKKVRHTLTFRL